MAGGEPRECGGAGGEPRQVRERDLARREARRGANTLPYRPHQLPNVGVCRFDVADVQEGGCLGARAGGYPSSKDGATVPVDHHPSCQLHTAHNHHSGTDSTPHTPRNVHAVYASYGTREVR